MLTMVWRVILCYLKNEIVGVQSRAGRAGDDGSSKERRFATRLGILTDSSNTIPEKTIASSHGKESKLADDGANFQITISLVS